MLVPLILAAGLALAPPPRTFRVDYYHTGNATEERFSLDRLVLEPLPFPGRPDRPIDETNLGKYFFEVRDVATNRTLYSRGFASVYGEWETTAEAQRANRAFSESLRFPAPAAPAQIIVKKRGAGNVFREVWSVVVDPKDKTVDDAPPPPATVIDVDINGPAEDKLDLLLVADGYTAKERAKFDKDVRRLVDALFQQSPFKERRRDFNVRALFVPTAQSGVSRPLTGIHRRSPIGASYDAFGSERYVLTFENRSLRDVASFAPYEFIEVLTNSRTYGGGGIFNLYSTVAADSLWSPYVFVHEFGHHFAGLADEYYTSEVAYEAAPAERVEPWEPNVTALHDPKDFKWKDLVSPGTPLPTPWNKEAFEEHSRATQEKRRKIRAENRPEDVMDALFTEQKKEETRMFAAEKYAGKVGAFEGAMYEAKGYYRPQPDCIMFSRDDVPFCAVCRRAIERIIDFYSGVR
jgi:hypothetical protein